MLHGASCLDDVAKINWRSSDCGGGGGSGVWGHSRLWFELRRTGCAASVATVCGIIGGRRWGAQGGFQPPQLSQTGGRALPPQLLDSVLYYQ